MTQSSPAAELQTLLALTIETIEARERSLAEDLSLIESRPFVLFGAGALGRWVLERLRQAGVVPSAFIDNNPALWGKNVDGVPAMSLDDATGAFGQDVPVIVTVYTGAGSAQATPPAWVPGLLVSRPCPSLPRSADSSLRVDRPAKMVGHADTMQEPQSGPMKPRSGRIAWRRSVNRLTFEDVPPGLPPAQTYFPDQLVVPVPDEVFVDCGAYDGDSIHNFLAAAARCSAASSRWSPTPRTSYG